MSNADFWTNRVSVNELTFRPAKAIASIPIRQERAEDGICLEPSIESVRIPQIEISHDGPLPIETSHELLDIGGKKLVDRPNTKPKVEGGKSVTGSAQPNRGPPTS